MRSIELVGADVDDLTAAAMRKWLMQTDATTWSTHDRRAS